MGRPDIPDIVIPTRRSLADPSKRCGQTWSDDVVVRKPFGQIDRAVFELERLGDYSVFDSFEEGPGLLRSAQAGIDAAAKMFSDNRDFIDGTNRNALQKLIDRAQSYVNAANGIWHFWNDEYRFYSGGGSGWPLGLKLQDFLPGMSCWNKSAGQQVESTPVAADRLPRGKKFKWNCPHINITQGHRSDETNYLKLVKAAMLNARCAQEAVASVAAYYQNKARRPPMTNRIVAAPRMATKKRVTVKKQKLVPSGQEPDFEPGDPLVETVGDVVPTDEVDVTEPEPVERKRKKKKGKGLLIAGAAVVAFFALKK